MADGDGFFTSVAGFIQFPVEERELDSGQTVRDATIRSLVSGNLVRITFWPDFAEAEIEEGMFIAVDGKANVRTVGEGKDKKTYTNMSARKLSIGQSVEPAEREVVNKKSTL